MQVLKLTLKDGRSFHTDNTTEEHVRQFIARNGPLHQIDELEMTPEEYFAIPATSESAKAFGKDGATS